MPKYRRGIFSHILMNEKNIGFILTLPAIAIMVILTVYPIAYTLYLSFHKVELGRVFKMDFVGLANYIATIKDYLFNVAFLNTLTFVAGATTLEVLLGLAFALVMMWEFWGRRYIVPLVVLPMMLPTIVICSFWRIMYHTEFGVINALLRLIGLPGVNWLGDSSIAMLSIIIVDLWQYTPFVFLILLAGMLSIPRDLLEAAEVDGASRIQLIKYIVLPMIKGHIVVVALLRIIDTFRIFDKVFALTGGGPGVATETLTFVIYKNAFRYYNFGYGASQATLMLIAVLIIIVIYLRMTFRGGRS